jgi:hypothetical protein
MTNEEEIWRKHPEYKEIEVSIFGRVRTLDKLGSRKTGTYSKKRTRFKSIQQHQWLYASKHSN